MVTDEIRQKELVEAYVETENSVDNRAAVSQELLGIHGITSNRFWQGVTFVSILFVLGIIGFVMRLNTGFDNSDKYLWGYYLALFSFFITTASAAPMVAIAPRIANANWRRPISRAAELWSLAGCLSLILFIPLLWLLPSLEDGRRSLWFFGHQDKGGDCAFLNCGVPAYSPQIWATLAIVSLALLGLGLLWVSCLPDFAALRDQGKGWRKKWGGRLALGWRGTSHQWNWQYHRMGILGALYFMMLVFVHFFVSVDFLMVHVPGWIDSLYPVTHAHNALQAGVATMMLTMFFLRQFGGYKDYIGLDQFWGLGKLLLALSLLWFWFWFSSFNVLWYGKKPSEQAVIELLIKGPYLTIFLLAFLFVFIVPWFTMIWIPLRRSIWGPAIIAVSVLVGTMMDRIRMYVASWSVEGIGNVAVPKDVLHIDNLPKAVMPQLWDVLLIVGFIAGGVLIYMLATRIIPAVNIWEQKEMLLYKAEVQYHRAKLLVMGKPR